MTIPRAFALGPLLAIAALASCQTGPKPAPAPAAPVHVVVAGINDLHGNIDVPPDPVTPGGLSVIAAYVDILRAQYPGEVVFLDAGDMFQGTIASNLNEGAAVVAAYNAMHVDAAALGNHEFDYGPVGERSVPTQPGDDPLGAIKARMAEAKFAILSANTFIKATGKPPEWPGFARWTILERAGLKIGVIGLSTPNTPNVTLRVNVESLEFRALKETVEEGAAALRAAGAQVVLVTAHAGSGCRDLRDPRDISSCDEGEAIALLRELPAGTVDAFVAGHTHSEVAHIVSDTPVVETSAYGKQLAWVELWVDPVKGVLRDRSVVHPPVMMCRVHFRGSDHCDAKQAPKGAETIPATFLGRTVKPVAAIAQIIQPYLEAADVYGKTPLGVKAEAAFTRDREAESSLGDLFADALREALHADIAILNSGGLRKDLPAGDLLYQHLYEAIPFDNSAAMLELSGAELHDLMKYGTNGGHGLFQVSGLKVTVDWAKGVCDKPEERDRVVSVELDPGGAPDPAKTYRVATNEFLAGGGDGLGPLISRLPAERVQVLREKPLLRDVIVDWLKKRTAPLSPRTDGRVRILNPGARCPK